MLTSNRAFLPSPNPAARLRLICLPSAGSGASMYRTWGKWLPKEVEVVGLHLPGREALMAEPLLESIDEMRLALRPVVEPYLDRPYALFGHSMGSWVAFELARAIVLEGESPPAHLFASGRRAPQIQGHRTAFHKHGDDELVRTIVKVFGGIPAAVLAEPELMKLLLPVLRADMTAVETYEYKEGSPLPCPITVFGGRADNRIAASDLQGWGDQTRSSLEVQLFPGSHFYLNGESQESLCQHIGNRLLGAPETPE